MRRLRAGSGQLGLAGAAVLGLGAAAIAETVTKVAILNPEQEPGAVTSDAIGAARIIIDTDANTLSYHIAYTGLSAAESAAHIHGPADIGVNAGVLHPLPAGNPKVGVWNYDEADEADILANRTYINIHTTAFGGGEIRGQLVDMVAFLDGAQANSPSGGTGFGLFSFDKCTNTLDYYIEYANLATAEVVSHIHGEALPTESAGIIHPLPGGSPKVGSWTFDEDQEDNIRKGRTYVNIHTMAVPGGEIRGQIVPIVVPLDGAQESPPLAVDGAGFALLSFDRDSDELAYILKYANLTGPATAAHIHGYAAAGSPAGVQHGVGTFNPAIGIWNYPAADEAQILDAMTYFNVHTAMHGGGEIRGQIVLPGAPVLADLTCDGTVNVFDLLDLLGDWGDCAAGPCNGDITRDGTVNVFDLLDLLGSWGDVP